MHLYIPGGPYDLIYMMQLVRGKQKSPKWLFCVHKANSRNELEEERNVVQILVIINHQFASNRSYTLENLYFNLLQSDFMIYFKRYWTAWRLYSHNNPPAKCWSAVPAAYYPAPSLSVPMNEVCHIMSGHVMIWCIKKKKKKDNYMTDFNQV